MEKKYICGENPAAAACEIMYIMVIRAVEFSSGGGAELEIFLPKNQHIQRKLLNFEN